MSSERCGDGLGECALGRWLYDRSCCRNLAMSALLRENAGHNSDAMYLIHTQKPTDPIPGMHTSAAYLAPSASVVCKNRYRLRQLGRSRPFHPSMRFGSDSRNGLQLGLRGTGLELNFHQRCRHRDSQMRDW